MKAATARCWAYFESYKISIHAAREGGDDMLLQQRVLEDISIHAAREGGDREIRLLGANDENFNPRRP